MGHALQRKKPGNQPGARKKHEARNSRSEFSQSEAGVRQSIKGAKSQPAIYTRPAPVNRPVTHITAGMQVPVSNKALKSRFGIGESPVDGALLAYSDVIESVLSAGLDNNWTTVEAVEKMLSSYEFASPEQGKNSFYVANEVLKNIYNEVRQINEPVHIKLAASNHPTKGGAAGNVFKAQGGDWEQYFVAGTYEKETVSEYNITPTGLIAGESGLCVMFNELFTDNSKEPLDELTINVAQFIQFCCALSDHASTLDMILDDMIKWLSIGELADLEEKEEQKLMAATDSHDEFYAAMQSSFGEDFEEELYLSYTTIADYFISIKQANSINKQLKPFCLKNVKAFLKKIRKSSDTPEWLITATELLLTQCDWSIDMHKSIQRTGHIPFAYTKPCGLGFAIEEHIFNSLHENFMNGEEDVVSLCIPFGPDTVRVLANLDLGETLLLFANEMLYTNSDA